MEKTKEEQKKAAEQISKSRNQAIWDCGSSLYDSFELKALQKQLDSAITSRTLSMPHFSDRRRPPSPPQPSKSKISRSFQKLIRAVFRPKRSSMTNKDDKFGERFGYEQSKEGFYVIYDRPPSLQRTASERVAAYTSTGTRASRFTSGLSCRTTGPVRPVKTGDKPECLKWLDEQTAGSVLFVSLGSGGTLSTIQLKELALGLEKSGQRFLFVARRPNDNVKNAAFFAGSEMKTGPLDSPPNGFIARNKEKGIVVAHWAPQIEVLTHLAVGGFLSWMELDSREHRQCDCMATLCRARDECRFAE